MSFSTMCIKAEHWHTDSQMPVRSMLPLQKWLSCRPWHALVVVPPWLGSNKFPFPSTSDNISRNVLMFSFAFLMILCMKSIRSSLTPCSLDRGQCSCSNHPDTILWLLPSFDMSLSSLFSSCFTLVFPPRVDDEPEHWNRYDLDVNSSLCFLIMLYISIVSNSSNVIACPKTLVLFCIRDKNLYSDVVDFFSRCVCFWCLFALQLDVHTAPFSQLSCWSLPSSSGAGSVKMKLR